MSFTWFNNKQEGSAFAKVATATDKLQSAKGKMIALNAAHANLVNDAKDIKQQADVWHTKLDNLHDSLDSILDTL